MHRSESAQKGKILFVSPVIPPHPAGVSVILKKLLNNWELSNYCLAATEPASKELLEQTNQNSNRHYLQIQSTTNSTGFFFKLYNKVKRVFFSPLRTYRLYMKLHNIILKDKVSKLVYCTGDLLALPICYKLSKKHNIPLLMYVFDDYIHQWPYPIFRKLVKHIEKKCLKDISDIITTNEFLALAYFDRYKILPKVIHNGLNENILTNQNEQILTPSRSQDAIKIVYTGSIYYAHYDVFLKFIEFLENTKLNIELHIYTSQDHAMLRKKGLRSPKVYLHAHVPHHTVMSILQSADVLFLPLSFNQKYKQVIETAAPCKMAEYLASGTTVLACVPSGSFVSWYFKTHQCGLVVNTLSQPTFENAFKCLIQDVEALNRFNQNARKSVTEDFTYESIQAKFKRIIESQENQLAC